VCACACLCVCVLVCVCTWACLRLVFSYMHTDLLVTFGAIQCAFSAMTVLVGRQEEHPACIKIE